MSSRPPPDKEPPLTFRQALVTWMTGAVVVLASYVLIYPIRRFRVPLGSDTPVYVWWGRFAGAAGLGGMGTQGRAVIVALLPTLGRITGTSVAAVAEALAPILAVCLGLAAAALIQAAFGRDRLRFVLAVSLTGTFLSLLVPGYLSTLAFGSLFVAALATLADGLDVSGRRPVVAAAFLVGLAGLSHGLFLLLAGAVLGGAVLALLPESRRESKAGVPLGRTGAGRVAIASLGGAALAGIGFLAVGGGLPTPETSRDSVLRRSGMDHLLTASYQRKLRHDFPWYRAATAAAALALPLLRRPQRWARYPSPHRLLFWGSMSAWLAVAAGGVVALLGGLQAPGQRLAAFCVPIPILAVVGLSSLGRPQAALAGALVFGVVAWLAWGGQRPLVPPTAVAQAQVAGRAIALEPPGTPLILVADDRSDKPSLFLTRYVNYLRDAVPAARVPDVHLFVGTPQDLLQGDPSLTGHPEHDALAREAWAEVRPLLAGEPVAVVIQAFDGMAYARAATDRRNRIVAGGGVVLLDPYLGVTCCPARDAAHADPGAGPLSPWLPVWLAPTLLSLLTIVGLPWSVRVAFPRRDRLFQLALAPAAGAAVLGMAAVIADLAGLRLAGLGAWVALAAVVILPWIPGVLPNPGRASVSPR